MKMKQKIQYSLDIVMSIILIFLMAYQLIGESNHEWLGIGMFLLSIIHQIFNWRWYKNLFRGTYKANRLCSTIINILIFIIMILMAISGMIMSKYVFVKFNFDGVTWARTLHLVLSYWGFVLMAIHIGFHWHMILNTLKRKLHLSNYKYLSTLPKIIILSIILFGLYALNKRQLLSYMFLKSRFVFYDFNEPIFYFIFDFLMIFALFIYLGYFVSTFLRRYSQHIVQKKSKHKNI